MKKVISPQQMKHLDNTTINQYNIPSLTLMENAGYGCAEYLLKHHSSQLSKGIAVLCGHGNNGGDGYVIARKLVEANFSVVIVVIGAGKSSPETLRNKELCNLLKIEIIELNKEIDWEQIINLLKDKGVILDAIYGIGFQGSLEGKIRNLIEKINELSTFKVAIDIPSGLNAESGKTDLAFKADLTLSMAALKTGLLLGKGKEYCGRLEVIDIGIPDELWQKELIGYLPDEKDIHLPKRSLCSHKGNYGRIAVFAGSEGYTGAAFMCTKAALRAGAGLVTIYSHPHYSNIFYNKPYEAMWSAIPLSKDDNIEVKKFIDILYKTDVVLFGPGCGLSETNAQALLNILKYWDKPLVLDADGLTLLSQHPEWYKYMNGKQMVLTPHYGEFCRLAHLNIDTLIENPLLHLKEFVDRHKVSVLLKSHISIFYDGNSLLYNITGNDGLAKGGSGDILCGLLAGFLAQEMSIKEASISAAWHLGKAAEKLALKRYPFSIMATDLLDDLFTMKNIFDENKETH